MSPTSSHIKISKIEALPSQELAHSSVKRAIRGDFPLFSERIYSLITKKYQKYLEVQDFGPYIALNFKVKFFDRPY